MQKPFDFVIFGGAGDLALRKLIPAWYRAYREGQMPKGSRIFGTSRKQDQVDGYREMVREAAFKFLRADEIDNESWAEFEQCVHGVYINITEFDDHWKNLAKTLDQGAEERVFYMATPPAVFSACCKNIHDSGMISEHARVVVEKPLGYDTESAEAINAEIAQYFDENAIFRIDHYLGKETVQNLLALRFTNCIFEHLWDAKSIDHVEISISETVGLEGRASFYDDAGALRDMVQNHLMQLLCLVAMEPPSKLNADSIRAEKLKVLDALRPLVGDDVATNTVRGQYVAGVSGGKEVPGYLDELGKDSNTETFVAIRAHIDNWRWSNVPFYLRTGKRLKQRCAEIIIQYKTPTHHIYPESAGNMVPNRLVIQLQPDERIQMIVTSNNLEKHESALVPSVLNLNLTDHYEKFYSDAYKRLMLDAAANNPALFIHRNEVEAAWKWIDPIIEAWQRPENKPKPYPAGSWGPQASEDLLSEGGCGWFNVGENIRGN
ncbi:glucose-6-phosphate dehydrogenase [Gilvimarinus agarilyticus]|uniref:glucose-6-phosphate dehydrogenase n=1 Tax=unclassified Gilvimarinus TaxID=2642066 RepID=UPI001C0A1D60|nr:MULTISPECIES: glucose-6-phosphate dehydrogenase [unclassified Gilvimarinus]MBU2886454.1 glucose-6-phosphate dehydrogenase [Gilvimarinus agarilyticus]MDO6571133.1 glucose-6-phosphate dehydrogenase [Gilvimarinus sp. 2_MG-2023]MDO6745676.1 glucose-6-phosphate dehydrogenase [Gilvimarinus sp. 1_MG-2023]